MYFVIYFYSTFDVFRQFFIKINIFSKYIFKMPYSSKVAHRDSRIHSIDAKSYPNNSGFPYIIGRNWWSQHFLASGRHRAPGALKRWNTGGKKNRGAIPHIGMTYNTQLR